MLPKDKYKRSGVLKKDLSRITTNVHVNRLPLGSCVSRHDVKGLLNIVRGAIKTHAAMVCDVTAHGEHVVGCKRCILTGAIRDWETEGYERYE